MPLLSRFFIRSSLVYLILGFTLGALLLANKGASISPKIWALLPAHVETVLPGWFLQLAFGVAFWILPRLRQPAPRGDERLAWGSYFLINLGIWLVIAGSLSITVLEPAGRIAEAIGAASFVVANWRRVKPFAG